MHKLIILIVILIFVSSCKKPENNKLVGKWKEEELNKSIKSFEVITNFTKDSVIIESISNGKKVDKLMGSYTLTNNLINIKGENNFSFDFKILTLNDSVMELLNIKEKKAIRYLKVLK